jgi:hypothetical protein
VEGRVLSFRLAGINNQNFIMQDRETNSWWQQVSGEAIQGPMRGKKLTRVFHDEMSYGEWMRELPGGRVLLPASDTAWKRFSEGWEEGTAKLPVKIHGVLDSALEPRALIAGIEIGNASKADPMDRIRAQAPIHDRVGGVPIVLLLAADGKSVRAFEARLDTLTLEFVRVVDGQLPGASGRQAGGSNGLVVDVGTASQWSFSGRAISGPLQGRQLKPVYLLLDYWFDWKTYHPNTSAYTLGGTQRP